MCGIFGYCNFNHLRSKGYIKQVLLDGLQNLEYRGYDSAGIAVDGEHSLKGVSTPVVIKAQGKVAALREKVAQQSGTDDGESVVTHVGIAHTRWATHGPPSDTNAHPHVSDDSHEFVVVHNGTITNYRELKDFLQTQGHKFYSDTDTEVIAKLCKYVYDAYLQEGAQSLKEATESHEQYQPVELSQIVYDVAQKLEGAYALLVKSKYYAGELVATTRGSPLIMGLVERDAMLEQPRRSLGRSQTVGLKNAGSAESPIKVSVSSIPRVQTDWEFVGTPSGLPPRALERQLSVKQATSPTLDQSTFSTQQSALSEWLPGAREIFFASDATAIIPHTNRVIYFDDDDLYHIVKGECLRYRVVTDSAYSASQPQVFTNDLFQKLDMEIQSIQKGGYPHFMLKEICEQPETVQQTMSGRVLQLPNDVNPYEFEQIRLGGLIEHRDTINACQKMFFIACGTSYNAALACKLTVEELLTVPVQLELASDLQDRPHCSISRQDVCVFVSQSGETADTIRALEIAKGKGAFCIGITNTVGSQIARLTTCGVHVNAGSEIGVASTKAYTSQIIAITLMALYLSEDSIRRRKRRDQIIKGLHTLSDSIKKALAMEESIKQLADELQKSSSLLVFGRGYNYATALETALKVKEVAYIHSEGMLAGEMKHGPLALVDECTPVLVLATKDNMHRKMVSGVLEILIARHANLLVLCNEGDEEIDAMAEALAASKAKQGSNGAGAPSKAKLRLIKVPHVDDALQCVVNIVPLQLLSYHLATLLGLDVDQPRNLAKSVTVTEAATNEGRK